MEQKFKMVFINHSVSAEFHIVLTHLRCESSLEIRHHYHKLYAEKHKAGETLVEKAEIISHKWDVALPGI